MVRYAAATGFVLLSTVVSELIYRLTGTTRLSMIFLAGILVSAYVLGSGPAYLAAALAFFFYLWLVDPRFEISFGSTEDFLTLTMFLAVAMLTGNLTGRVRDEAARAKARARTTEALLAATREFSASSDEAFIRERLAHHLSAAARGAAMVRDRLRLVVAPADVEVSPQLVREAAALEKESRELPATTAPGDGWTLRSLKSGGVALGVAGWRAPARGARDSEEDRLLEILADAAAAALARARLSAAKAEIESHARTEVLRNALLSSISHDLRTPLAAIMASASSLHDFGETFDETTRRDLAATIQEETERLDTFVGNLLNMTRLEAGALSAQRVPFNVPEVIERTLERRLRAAPRTIGIAVESGLSQALGDPVLFEQALGNLVENALRHTPQNTALTLSARELDGLVVVELADEGPGVPETELSLLFEKFFRGGGAQAQPGTGLGLSIVRGLIEGMGGAAAARLHTDGASGLVMTLSLPAAR